MRFGRLMCFWQSLRPHFLCRCGDRKFARRPPKPIASVVTNKPKKKDSDMKIEKKTYKDRKERPNGMTADHTSRPDKVLFFADTHFLFKSRHTIGTLPFAPHTSPRFAKVKEPKLPSFDKNNHSMYNLF